MLIYLKKIVYKLLFIVLILFSVNIYINYKIEKMFEDFKQEQAEKVAEVKENIFEGGFFD